MTRLEDRLREAYRAVTGTVREEDLPGLDGTRAWARRRSRFRTVAPLAAAAVVVVAIVASVVVPRLASSPSRPAASATPATSAIRATSAVPAGPPPFVVILNKPDSRGNVGPLAVVSAATGRITGRVPDPRAGTTWSNVAVTGSGTMFVLSAVPTRGGLCNPTYLYKLTLSARGAPASLTPWTDPVVPAEIDSLTASADGGAVAFIETECHGPGEEIGFIRGDRMKTWQEPDLAFAEFLSLSADGSVLGYIETGMGQGGRVRVLDTSAAAGSAAAAGKIIYTCPASARGPSVVIGADAATMYVAWVTGFDTFHVAGYRIGPGGVQGMLFRRTLPTGLHLSWAGGQLLTYDQQGAVYLIDPGTGKTTRVRGAWTVAVGIYW